MIFFLKDTLPPPFAKHKGRTVNIEVNVPNHLAMKSIVTLNNNVGSEHQIDENLIHLYNKVI